MRAARPARSGSPGATSPGRSLEAGGNAGPRGMTVTGIARCRHRTRLIGLFDPFRSHARRCCRLPIRSRRPRRYRGALRPRRPERLASGIAELSAARIRCRCRRATSLLERSASSPVTTRERARGLPRARRRSHALPPSSSRAAGTACCASCRCSTGTGSPRSRAPTSATPISHPSCCNVVERLGWVAFHGPMVAAEMARGLARRRAVRACWRRSLARSAHELGRRRRRWRGRGRSRERSSARRLSQPS